MKKLYLTTMTAAVLGFALASSAVAQQPTNLPKERTSAGSCADVDWNQDMLRNHPALIDACQEVIVVEGETWARFAAKFVRIEPDGDVIFSVRDKRDRSIQEVTLDPTPGQVAYIDDRATPFSSLRTTDRISLYVPEGQFGFATRPVAQEELATVIVPTDSTRTVDSTRTSETEAPVLTTETAVAQRDTRSAMLPTTAGPLPWLALLGLLSMLGGLGLTLRRWN
jgi:hypothetical protein